MAGPVQPHPLGSGTFLHRDSVEAFAFIPCFSKLPFLNLNQETLELNMMASHCSPVWIMHTPPG